MDREPKHVKTVRHFDLPGHAHELTFSCYQRWPLLADHRYKAMFSHSVSQAVVRQRFQLLAFVFMPEHVHLLVFPRASKTSVASLLSAMKRPFSYRVKRLLEQECDPLLERLTIRERP